MIHFKILVIFASMGIKAKYHFCLLIILSGENIKSLSIMTKYFLCLKYFVQIACIIKHFNVNTPIYSSYLFCIYKSAF